MDTCLSADCALMLVFRPRPKPKMLFLDDKTKRIESARRKFGAKFNLTIVTNTKECLRYLAQRDWSEVRLGHDLNGEDFQDPDSPTSGMEVVRYILKTGWPPNKPKPIFRIHSTNVFAAWAMVKQLQGAGYIAMWDPFQYEEAAPCVS